MEERKTLSIESLIAGLEIVLFQIQQGRDITEFNWKNITIDTLNTLRTVTDKEKCNTE